MLHALFVTLALAAGAEDTTVAVSRGQRLTLSLHNGEVTLRAWNRDEVKVTDVSGRAPEVTVDRGAVTVRAGGRWGLGSADLVIDAPAWMAASIDGVGLDVHVEGMQGGLRVETVQGDVTARRVGGTVALTSVEGSVVVEGADGRVDATTVNDDVTVRDVTGDVTAGTVNGDVILEAVRAAAVEGTTINGDIRFDGPFRDGGRYAFSTHGGDLRIAVPEGTSASVTVSTFDGSFEADFPVAVASRSARKLSFVLGGGSARLELESFNGDIHLVRPGARR